MRFDGIILQSPSEIAFRIFGTPVYFYGVTMALAVLACILCANYFYKKFYPPACHPEFISGSNHLINEGKILKQVQDDITILDLAPYLIIAGLLGARLYYCALNFSYYAAHPLEVFAIRQGGLSVHGMIIVGAAALWAFAKHYKLSVAKLLDTFAVGAILGQTIGRWGNFFNQEAFGVPSDGWLKLFIPVEKRPLEYVGFDFFHPAFLYESVLNLVIFAVLVLLFRRLSARPGTIACLYLILYSTVRIFVESLRVDSVLNIGTVPFAQIISVVIIFVAAIFMIKLKYVHRNN